MVQSDAATVDAYLAELPSERRATVEEVRRVILANLPDGYDETMRWGMISYEVPLDRYPDTYNKKPLQFVALGAQKHYTSLYLTNVAFSPGGEERFRQQWEQTGKKLDMGRSCVRFKSVDDLALDLIAETIASSPVDVYLAHYETARAP